ncbi:hypothetical protein AX15_001334 [Amanita polypyramis BW_CC]|nr:hypothetical protein AX15_001334 [Amanita polypyramis BW_CC]
MLTVRASAFARSFAFNARRYASSASSAPKQSANWPVYILGVGTAGIGGYWYLESKSKHSETKQEKSPFDPEKFVDFTLKRVVPYNHNTAKYIFELPDNQASLLPVASCLVVRSSDPEALKDANGKPVIRPYTPISPPDLKGELVLLIKQYENGKGSKYIHSLKEGETLAIKGPISKFPYKVNEFDEVVLIGGGTGITPLYQVLEHALADKSNKTKFKLLFSNITEKDILLREELDDLKMKYPKTFDIVYLVDAPGQNWTGPSGYITGEIIKQHAAPPSLGDKLKIFVCGPPGQVAAIAGKKNGGKQGELGGVLKALGYSENQVFKF